VQNQCAAFPEDTPEKTAQKESEYQFQNLKKEGE